MRKDGKSVGQGDFLEDVAGVVEAVAVEALQPREFLVQQLLHPFVGDDLAVVRDGAGVDPLPELGAGDLRGGGVLHQVVDGHGAVAAQPGLDVADAHLDVVADALLGDGALRWRRRR